MSFQHHTSLPDIADNSLDAVQLAHCTGNWTCAEKDPELLESLLDRKSQHCAGFSNASHMTASGHCSKHRSFAAMTPQMPWLTKAKSASAAGSSRHRTAHGSQKHGQQSGPQLTGDPQQYIACFEALAQLALAMTARRAHGAMTEVRTA